MRIRKEKKVPSTDPQGEKESLEKKEILKKLNGRTLMVYFVLLNKTTIGVRELQHHLGLSSPSVAKYHLEKLTQLNLVENRNGVYWLIRKADLPIITSWILVGKYFFPKVLFVAIFFTSLFLGYLIGVYSFWNKDSLFVILFGTLIAGYSWFDVFQQYKNKPF